jgi:hypothetical protein
MGEACAFESGSADTYAVATGAKACTNLCDRSKARSERDWGRAPEWVDCRAVWM